MRDLALPPRVISGRSELTEMQQIFLDCYILRMGSPRVLFRMLLGVGKSENMSNTLMMALLNSADGKEYVRQRQKQLEEFFFKSTSDDVVIDTTEASMEEARKVIYSKVSQELVQGLKDGTINYKSSAIIEKFMQKAMDFTAEKVEAPEPPRIYLPENCLNCRYRVACESEDVVDDCKWCKYRKSCNERGEVYDQKTQLEIPEEEYSQHKPKTL